MSLVKRTGAMLVAVFLTLGLMAPQTARAETNATQSITSASQWIADAWQNKRNQFFSAGTTADGIIALSAANQKPDTVRSMLVDLKKRGPAYSKDNPARLAKMILTADTSGQNPGTLFGCDRNLVTELQDMVKTSTTTGAEYWGPYLIAIALTRAGEEVPEWVIADMEKNQDATSGGFGYMESGDFIGDPDYTAVGISAMNLIEQNSANAEHAQRASASITQATTWSADPKTQKQDARSNSYYWETYSSTNSTGMLASALGEVGVEITSPVRYLTTQQKADGGWAGSHNGRTSNVMATTQAILGVIGEGYGTARSTQVPEMVTCGTTPPKPPEPAETVYNTPGYRVVNGREWRTTCEPYSQTKRCTATIKATTVTQVGGRFVVKNDYVFNNMTYLPSPRSLWKNNPLGGNGKVNANVSWTATDGRKWRTECDTKLTGRGGCRTFAEADVIETISRPGQSNQYRWVTKEIFNNIVQFS